MRQIPLGTNERLDDLQNGYWILQRPQLFCFGIDAVLLSSFAQVHARERCLDLGTGNGILPILLRSKTKGRQFVGLELNPQSAELARRSVELNELENQISIVDGDIKEAAKLFGTASFDVAITNPPYMPFHGGALGQCQDKAMARHEVSCTLEDVVREASLVLKEKGRLYMVHRPFRLGEILVTMGRYRLEAKRLRLVYPFVDKAPNLVLLEAKKGGSPGLLAEPPLIVYGEGGEYTPEVLKMYDSSPIEKENAENMLS